MKAQVLSVIRRIMDGADRIQIGIIRGMRALVLEATG